MSRRGHGDTRPPWAVTASAGRVTDNSTVTPQHISAVKRAVASDLTWIKEHLEDSIAEKMRNLEGAINMTQQQVKEAEGKAVAMEEKLEDVLTQFGILSESFKKLQETAVCEGVKPDAAVLLGNFVPHPMSFSNVPSANGSASNLAFNANEELPRASTPMSINGISGNHDMQVEMPNVYYDGDKEIDISAIAEEVVTMAGNPAQQESGLQPVQNELGSDVNTMQLALVGQAQEASVVSESDGTPVVGEEGCSLDNHDKMQSSTVGSATVQTEPVLASRLSKSAKKKLKKQKKRDAKMIALDGSTPIGSDESRESTLENESSLNIASAPIGADQEHGPEGSSGVGDAKVSPVFTDTVCEGRKTNVVSSDNVKGDDKNILTELGSNTETLPRVMAISLADAAQITPYSGSSKEDLNAFIRSFQDRFNLTEDATKPENKVRFLLAYLRDEARDTVQEILDKKNDATFDELVGELKKRFAHSAMGDRYREQLRSRKMRPDETVEEFYRAITRLVKQIHNSTTTDTAKDSIFEHFLFGLRDNMKMGVKLHKPKNPREALEAALDVEAMLPPTNSESELLAELKAIAASVQGKPWNNGSSSTQEGGSNQNRFNNGQGNGNYRKKGTCHYCKKEGHFVRECLKRARDHQSRNKMNPVDNHRQQQPQVKQAMASSTELEYQAKIKALTEQVDLLKRRNDQITADQYETDRMQCYMLQHANETTVEQGTSSRPGQYVTPQILVRAEGIPCWALIDTGASVSVATRAVAKLLGVARFEPNSANTIVGVGGNTVPVIGSALITFRIGATLIEHRIRFMEDSSSQTSHEESDFILGIDILSRLAFLQFDYHNRRIVIGSSTLSMRTGRQAEVVSTRSEAENQDLCEMERKEEIIPSDQVAKSGVLSEHPAFGTICECGNTDAVRSGKERNNTKICNKFPREINAAKEANGLDDPHYGGSLEEKWTGETRQDEAKIEENEKLQEFSDENPTTNSTENIREDCQQITEAFDC